MEDSLSLSGLSASPAPELPLTISPADTSLDAMDTLDTAEAELDDEETKSEEKKPTKKRKSWGQELPVPKTNLPPRKRAKTDDEKEQRRIERVLRNRAAAQTSRERKRLEMEKLENEKIRVEQQNQLLLSRLAQMEAENNRLSRQVAQLSAEIRGPRSVSPPHVGSSPISSASPTLAPTLFKNEGDDLALERIPYATPSLAEFSPTLEPSSLAESSDLTQHPAAVLCDLQCQSLDSKESEMAQRSLFLWTSTSKSQQYLNPALAISLHTLQLLFLTMTSAAYSTVTRPLSQILHSLKTGSPLTFSTVEIYQHFPLILWLISTPSLSPPSSSAASTRRSPVFRMRLLTRLLACSPALARPLRDATGKALQLAVSEQLLSGSMWPARDDVAVVGGGEGPTWESLLTMAWAIDSLDRSRRARRTSSSSFSVCKLAQRGRAKSQRGSRRLGSFGRGETWSSLLSGKQLE